MKRLLLLVLLTSCGYKEREYETRRRTVSKSGQEGAKGATGATGNKGASGEVGPKGDIGPQGLPGRDEVNGVNEVDGVNGTDGLNGINGATGPTGAPGPEGLQGPQGEEGEDGAIVEVIFPCGRDKGDDVIMRTAAGDLISTHQGYLVPGRYRTKRCSYEVTEDNTVIW